MIEQESYATNHTHRSCIEPTPAARCPASTGTTWSSAGGNSLTRHLWDKAVTLQKHERKLLHTCRSQNCRHHIHVVLSYVCSTSTKSLIYEHFSISLLHQPIESSSNRGANPKKIDVWGDRNKWQNLKCEKQQWQKRNHEVILILISVYYLQLICTIQVSCSYHILIVSTKYNKTCPF